VGRARPQFVSIQVSRRTLGATVVPRDQLANLVRHLHQTVTPGSLGGLTDSDLLARFIATRDRAAFEVLVWRYGPMVLGLCRRVLRHAQDAEDAFQATFLTLVRKASSISKRDLLGCWLHQVAYRLALRMRALTQQRGQRETPGLDLDALSQKGQHDPSDLRAVLDEELGRLPARYRQPFVLRYLAGLSNEETAQRLGCPEGTVSSRLARARVRLRSRLTRRGLAPAWGVAGLLAASEARAVVPISLVQTTLTGVAWPATAGAISARAAALTEGMLRTMFLRKIALALALLAVTLGGLGGGTAAFWRLGQVPAEAAAPMPKADKNNGWELTATYLDKDARKLNLVALSPDGKKLAVVQSDKSLKVYDAVAGKELGTFLKGHPDKVGAVCFSSNGKLLAAGSGSLAIVWDVKSGAVKKSVRTSNPGPNHIDSELRYYVSALAFSPDDKLLAVCNRSESWVQLADMSSERDVLKPGSNRSDLVGYFLKGVLEPIAISFRADGSSLAVAGYVAQVNRGREGVTTLTRVDLDEVRRTAKPLPDHDAGISCVAYSPDGKLIAGGSPDHDVLVYNAGTGKVKETLVAHAGPVRAVAFSPDNKLLASSGDDKTVIIWDMKTAKPIARLKGHKNTVLALRWAKDVATLTSADECGVVKVWELKK
jgi:RNA polymerase sigma factor (sigma-70 family)